MFSKTFYDHFGRGYCFSPFASAANQSLLFIDDVGAQEFLRSLRCTTSELQQLLFSIELQPYAGPDACINHLAFLLCQNRLFAYSYSTIEQLKTTGQTRFPVRGGGRTMSILPAASAAVQGAGGESRLISPEQAQACISELELSDDDAEALVQHLNLSGFSRVDGSAAPVSSSLPAKQRLAEALVRGDIVAEEVVQRQQSSQSSDSGETGAANTAGNRRADQEQPPAPEEPAPAEEETPECKLNKLVVSCSHDGRKQEITAKTGTTLELDVVASETSKRGFEKIKAKVDIASVCGSHTESSSTITPAPEKTVKAALENTYHLACEPISNPLNVLWLPSIKPSTYKIAASACDRFSPAAVNVNVYPKVSWSASVSYGFGSAESKSEWKPDSSKPRDKWTSYAHEKKSPVFQGKVEYNYDEKKEDLALSYKTEIDEVLKKLNWFRDKIDTFLKKIVSKESPVQLAVVWPNFALSYKASLEENKPDPTIRTTHEISFGASPLIGLKGSIDVFPMFLNALRTSGTGTPIVAIVEAAMEGVGSDKSVASFEAVIKLIFSVSAAININFSANGANGEDEKEIKSEQSLNMDFQMEGSIGAKGHIWIVKFEKLYRAGIKSGFVGKVVITSDDIGYYWYSRFLFNGLYAYFTSYEKLEKSVSNDSDPLAKLNLAPDETENSTTHEWTWIEPDPDEESPSDTVTQGGTPAALQNNRHYLIKF